MKDKASLFKIDELKEILENQRSVNVADLEKLTKRLDTLK